MIKNRFLYKKQSLEHKKITIEDENYFFIDEYKEDFRDIKGQESAIRAALVAASGNHNILLIGSPGCGKSMIAKRLPYIMTPMSLDEILESAKIEALDLKEPDFKPIRNRRSPHCTSSKVSILGGNSLGEIALANNGVLFFDELPHFSSSILEALREPLQDYRLLVSRANSKVVFDTKFLFIAAMNPCPCGMLLSKDSSCRCNELEIKKYRSRLSEPFLERIDLYVIMGDSSINDKSNFSSKQMHRSVIEAFLMQKSRGQVELNGKLSDEDINRFCVTSNEARLLLEKATTNLKLSFRSINNILKVSRTIADLDSSKIIEKRHIMEALSYRRR